MDNIWKKLNTLKPINQIKHAEKEFGIFIPNKLQSILIFIGKKSFLKRGIFRKNYTKFIMLLSLGPLDISFRGCAYRIWNDIDFLINGSSHNSNFIDIGSNIGLYSLPMALASPKGKTISIDANPLMQSRLNFNKRSSKISNIKMINIAVSDKKGFGVLKIRKDDIAIVALDESQNGDVEISTLNEILKNNKINKIYGLKIDIEGHEDKALVPFLLNAPKKILPKKIVIERPNKSQDYPGCKLAFEKLNYKLVGCSKNNSFYELIKNEK